MNPFDLQGPTFLALYVASFCSLLLARFALLAVATRRSVNPEGPKLSPFEIALLSGEDAAAVDAGVASLVRKGRVEIRGGRLHAADPGKLFVQTGVQRGIENQETLEPLERELRAVFAERGPLSLRELRALRLRALEQSQMRLEAMGLVVSGGLKQIVRTVEPAAVLALACAGAIKIGVGISRGRPILWLLLAVAATIAYAVLVIRKRFPHRTEAGDRLVEKLRDTHDALKLSSRRAPEQLYPDDAALAYALFGNAALVGPLAAVGAEVAALGSPVDLALREAEAKAAAVFRKPGGNWFSCGSGGFGGGGGCGGGGCGGGCGGCGG